MSVDRQARHDHAPSAARGRRLDPAEKVARAADRLLDGIGGDPVVARSREIHSRVTNAGGRHFVSHARLIALADALAEWREAKSRV
jgi:hypothetical protein